MPFRRGSGGGHLVPVDVGIQEPLFFFLFNGEPRLSTTHWSGSVTVPPAEPEHARPTHWPPCPGRPSRLPRPPLAERGRPSAAEPRPRLPCFLSSPVASWSQRRFSASESAGPHTPWGPEAVVSPCAGHRPQHLAVCHLSVSFEFLASCSVRHCALLALPRCEQRSVHGCVETCLYLSRLDIVTRAKVPARQKPVDAGPGPTGRPNRPPPPICSGVDTPTPTPQL